MGHNGEFDEIQKEARIDAVSKETIILNAHQLLRNSSKYSRTYLWTFIMDICAVGSTTAIAICREFGWNPNQKGSVPLSRK